MSLIYVTYKDKKEAERVSTHLLRKRLIACANMFPIKSIYWWEGKIEMGNEMLAICKTNSKNFPKIVDEIKKLHSYKIPCILKINAKANKEYYDWTNDLLCGLKPAVSSDESFKLNHGA